MGLASEHCSKVERLVLHGDNVFTRPARPGFGHYFPVTGGLEAAGVPQLSVPVSSMMQLWVACALQHCTRAGNFK